MVRSPATEDRATVGSCGVHPPWPVHLDLRQSQDVADGGGESLPLFSFVGEAPPACGGERIEFCAASQLTGFPLGANPSGELELLERRVDRAVARLKRFVRDLAEALADRPSVLRLQGDDFQEQQIERSLDQVGRSAHGLFSVTESITVTDNAVKPTVLIGISNSFVEAAARPECIMEIAMTRDSRRIAGILLVVLPTVMYGGIMLLTMLVADPQYMANPLRQDLWRAGHAHAGVLLILALVALRYVDEANLSSSLKAVVRSSIPLAAILMPAGFFLSVVSPDAESPSAILALTYVGAVVLAIGVVLLGVGLIRSPSR